MRFKVIITIWLLTLYCLANCQNKVIDSLKISLHKEKKDTSKVFLLQEIAKKWYGTNYDSARVYGKKSLQLSRKIFYSKGKAEALRILGNSYEMTRKPDSAFFYYKQSLAIHNTISNSKYKVALISNIGSNYHRMNKLDSAAYYYQEAIAAAIQLKDESLVNGTYHNLGYIYETWGNNFKALELYQKSLKIRLKIGDEILIASSYSVISGIYELMKEYRKSLEYSQNSIDIYHKDKSWLNYAFETSNKGNIYLSMKKYDSAKYCFEEAIKHFISEKQECYSSLGYINLSKTYFFRDQLDSAFSINEKGGAFALSCGLKRDQTGYFYQRGKILEKKGNLLLAEKAFLKTYAICEEIGRYMRKGDAAEHLYAIYKKQNKYKKALKYLEIYKSVNDSIFNEENTVNITKLNTKFEYEKEKQKLIFNQEKEKLKLIEEKKVSETRQTAAFISLGLTLIIVIVIVRAYKIKQDSNKELSTVNNQLSFANEKLKQLDQFKTRLFSNVNHDFRTPLTLIIGFISKIISNKDNYLTSESEEDLKNLERSSLKLMEMTEEINDILLLEEGKLVPEYSKINLVTYLNRTVKMFTSAANKSDILLEFKSLSEEQLFIHLDVNHFDKIIYNLLFNALRYTSQNGKVTVVLNNDKTNCLITIKDTGRGISPKFLPYIFDRYYQSDDNQFKSKGGFGIGLAVVKELIELHGGKIEVISEENIGSTFILNIPFNLDKPLTQSKEDETDTKEEIVKIQENEALNSMVGKEKNSNKATVLIVDDQEEIRQFISNLIESNYHVKQAANGNQALNLLARDEIDLIITDLMMPWLDGFELIDKIKKDSKLKKIPVMVISARTTEEDKLKVLDKGINNFLAKPFNPVELQKRIQNIFNKTEEQNNNWDTLVENKNFVSNVEQNILKKLNQLILDKIDDPNLTIEVIANELCASRSKTIKMIKSLTNKTPLVYIKTIRMDYVSHLIKSKKIKNTTEAANAIGMKNATQFTHQYQKMFGEPPF